MDNQKLFMELLKDLMEYAVANNNSISTHEIDDIFSDIELTSEQLEYIYDYMYTGGITVRGYVGRCGEADLRSSSASENSSTSKDSDEKKAEYTVKNGKSYDAARSTDRSSERLKQYRKNVRELETVDDEKLEEVCRRLLSGMADDTDKSVLTESHLVTVVNIAAKYAGKGVSSDELIQEGNLALVIGINELAGSCEEAIGAERSAASICEEYLRNKIRSGIIEHIDSVNETESAICATIAKAGLINEAVKALAAEYGRIATINELSAYTHIPVSEIQDIVRLSGDSIEIGKGNIKKI